jgi:SanA protein
MKVVRFFLKRWKLIAILGLLVALSPLVAIWIGRSVIAGSADGRVFMDVADVPECEVALVLGCARLLPNGRRNLYFKHRMAAVVKLWESGRVKHILVSGDNSRKDYDEPTDMKEALIEAGLPEDRIHCDYAGFRTLDSVVRAKDVFLLDRFVVVSQEFHVERALYIAKELGIEAFGFPARDVGGKAGMRTKTREDLARVKAVLDMKVLNTQPKFRGEPVPIVDPKAKS